MVVQILAKDSKTLIEMFDKLTGDIPCRSIVKKGSWLDDFYVDTVFEVTFRGMVVNNIAQLKGRMWPVVYLDKRLDREIKIKALMNSGFFTGNCFEYDPITKKISSIDDRDLRMAEKSFGHIIDAINDVPDTANAISSEEAIKLLHEED